MAAGCFAGPFGFRSKIEKEKNELVQVIEESKRLLELEETKKKKLVEFELQAKQVNLLKTKEEYLL